MTSKLITCFIGSFTSKTKSQSFVYLLNESELIYWILDLEDEVHLIWVIWTSCLQECKGKLISQSWGGRPWRMGFIKAMKNAFPGQGPTLGRCDLAWGVKWYPPSLNGSWSWRKYPVKSWIHMQEPSICLRKNLDPIITRNSTYHHFPPPYR